MRSSPLLAALAFLLMLLVQPAQGQTGGTAIDLTPRAGQRALGLNLATVAGWSTELPFIDVMHSAARWTGHTGDGWGGMDEEALRAAGALDEQGWVTAVPSGVRRISTFILQDLPAGMTSTAGRWHASWEGSAYLAFTGAASGVRFGPNSATFNFTPGRGPVLIELDRGTLRNLTIVHERNLARHQAGEVFNPAFLARLDGVAQLRFMDWMLTNNSTIERWDQRPQPGDYSWSWRGVPLEVMIRLANETGADPWFTLPHLADDDFVRRFATQVHDGLSPDLRAWYEYSNEVWNWSFAQADWAEARARARWDREWGWVQFAAVRAAEMMRLIDEVYGDDTGRRVRVLGLFTAYFGLERDMLDAPNFTAEDPANRPPREFFDAIAITGYFGGELMAENRQPMVHEWLRESRLYAEAAAEAEGLTGAAADDYVETHRFDRALVHAAQELATGVHSGEPAGSVADLVDRVFPYHAQVAAEAGLALAMYEGGTHVVVRPTSHDDDELIDFVRVLNAAPEMAVLYRRMIAGWRETTPLPFNAFNDIQAHNLWGSWGHLEHLDDDSPRWRALLEATVR